MFRRVSIEREYLFLVLKVLKYEGRAILVVPDVLLDVLYLLVEEEFVLLSQLVQVYLI